MAQATTQSTASPAFLPELWAQFRSLLVALKPRLNRRAPKPPHVPDPHEAALYDDLFYLALVHRYW